MEAHNRDRLAPIAYLPTAMLTGADDAALGRALARRDPRAEREACRRFHPLAHRIALHATGSRATAARVARRVLRRFFASADQILADPVDVPTALVLALTAREVRRSLRLARLRRVARALVPGRARPAPDLATDARDPFTREVIHRFVVLAERLGPLDRTAFSLRFIEGLGVAEVAAALDLPPASAKRRLDRVWRRMARRTERDAVLADLLAALPPPPEAGADDGDGLPA
jgi:RNA polymerase sigma-70 factor (ECF subfamily)